MHALDKNRMTPLHLASRRNNKGIVKLLADTGESDDDHDVPGKFSPVHSYLVHLLNSKYPCEIQCLSHLCCASAFSSLVFCTLVNLWYLVILLDNFNLANTHFAR